MSRWRASGIHLFISICIFGLFLVLTYYVWYPQPLFDAIGAWGLVQLLTGVDVVLGPLLTLILFKSGKKGLKFDLTMVALMQTAALAYGVHVVWNARPAFVVFAVDRFEVLQVNDALFVPLASPEFQQASLWGPRFASVELPTGQALVQVAMEAMSGGRDVAQRQEYYRSFDLGVDQIQARAKPMSTLLGREKSTDVLINAFLSEHGGSADSWHYLPLVAKQVDFVAIVDLKSGYPVHVLPIYPWIKRAD